MDILLSPFPSLSAQLQCIDLMCRLNHSKDADRQQGAKHRDIKLNVKRCPWFTEGIKENSPCSNIFELDRRLLVTNWKKGFSFTSKPY